METIWADRTDVREPERISALAALLQVPDPDRLVEETGAKEESRASTVTNRSELIEPPS